MLGSAPLSTGVVAHLRRPVHGCRRIVGNFEKKKHFVGILIDSFYYYYYSFITLLFFFAVGYASFIGGKRYTSFH